MSRFVHLICLTVLFSSSIAASAAAQSPQAGSIAAGGDIGVFFPDEEFEKAFALDAFGEYYATPNISIRGLFGWANPGFENFTEDHFRQVRLLFNAMYYWQIDNWMPYATAGAGAYFLRQLFDDEPDPDSETRGGINFGLGTVYSLGDGGAFKGELRWEIVSQPTGFPDATGISLMFGYKRYF